METGFGQRLEQGPLPMQCGDPSLTGDLQFVEDFKVKCEEYNIS